MISPSNTILNLIESYLAKQTDRLGPFAQAALALKIMLFAELVPQAQNWVLNLSLSPKVRTPLKIKLGTFRGFTIEFFVVLQPLHPRTRDLNLTVSMTNPIKPQHNYAAEWTFHLIVNPKVTLSSYIAE